MRKIAMVPIKLNSERVPNKNIKLLGNKPLISYILDTLLQVKALDDIYVFCSNSKIKEYLPEGVKFLKRDESLDLPNANFTQFFDAFMQVIDSDIYVFTHATAPFLTKATIELCMGKVENEGYDSAFTAVKIQDFLWKDFKPMNFNPANLPRSQDLEPIYRETSGVYVFKKEVFEKYSRRIGSNPYIMEVSWREAIDINTYEDFELANIIAGDKTDELLNLIFDFDGVIIDSEDVQRYAFYNSYKEVVGDDKCPDFSEYLAHTGDSLPNILRKMGLPLEMEQPYKRLSRESIDKIIIIDDVINFIKEVREQGIKCAICTGKDRARTIEILEYYGLINLFDEIVCSDDVSQPKPSAEPTLLAMKRLGGVKNNTVLIGDGRNDMLSARAAGVRSVLSTWCKSTEVNMAEADYCVANVKELRDIILTK